MGLTCDAKGVAREKIIYPCEYLVLQTTAVANLRVADSYLFKTGDAKWEDGIVALEGGTCSFSLPRGSRAHFVDCLPDTGSGLGAISRLLETRPNLFTSEPLGESEAEASLTTAAEVYSRIQ